MEPLTIELKNKNALPILKSLEKAHMIKLICKERQPEKSPVRLKGTYRQKPSVDVVNPLKILNRDQLRTFGFAQDAITLQPDFDAPFNDFND